MNDAKGQKGASLADAPIDVPMDAPGDAPADGQAAVGEPVVGEEGASPDDLAAQLQKAERQAAENRDQLLRARAEIENLRKRAERELAHAKKYAIEKFAFEMLAVKDSLELALREDENESAGASAENDRRVGLELMLKVLTQAFDKFEIEEINPHEAPFDPECHQAMLTQPSEEHPQGTVLSVMQKGYSVCGRLLRPALVAVAGAVPEGHSDDGGDDGGNAENPEPPEEKGA